MKLYELSSELRVLEQLIEGELPEQQRNDVLAQVTEAKLEMRDKVLGVAAFIKSLDAGAEALDKEIERQQARSKALKASADWLRGYILTNADKTQKYEDPKVKVSFKSAGKAPVMVENEALVPDDFKRVIPETKELDKTKLYEALSEGKEVPGAKLGEKKTTLTIK